MSYNSFDFKRSITSKQIVAVTGLGLILFVIFHLLGNLFIFLGPNSYNGYSHKLHSLGLLFKCAEWGLFIFFLIHIERVASLIVKNIKAKGGLNRYAVDNSKGPRSLVTRLMPFSGTYLICYVIWHLYDFSWASLEGPRSYIHGVSYGVYGVVVNAFKDPTHAFLYVLAMCFLGLHLAHGVQSFIQTFGFNDHRFTPKIKWLSNFFAVFMVVAYSSMPIYVLFFLKV